MNAELFFEVRDEQAAAVAAPGRGTLDYGGLLRAVERVGRSLRALGVESGEAVAVAAANGPEALVATLGVAAVAAVAPLNPALTAPECRFLLADLSARALVVVGDAGAAAIEAARDLAIPVLAARPSPGGPAGLLDVERPAGEPRPARTGGRDPSVALLLHTSGTTARPKLVALPRGALARSARAIARGLALGPADRCLNVMPLFHVHGLVGAALASLASGGSVCCTAGFNPLRFARWLDEESPTWYTAVPSMHQAVVARLDRRARPAPAARGLRFARSCSSPLPSAVRDALASCLEVPVVNAYGMTEAAHQVSSTPVEAGRAPGSLGGPVDSGATASGTPVCPVGVSSGPEVRVMDPAGAWLPPGVLGEIALRGDTVITAYEHPAEANHSSFLEGWLRTGDQGVVDARGEISLTGRLKELINASGEKVSPYEVEDVLLSHPAVVEAVCFAIPSAARGERVGAAVVLREGAAADERALRGYLAERLAPCKVPERVLTLAALPKGPTGKLQRIGLAGRLGP